MLAIRMQRTGRSGHAQFRMVVQDSRFNPKSGRVVAYVGHYDPHAKTATVDSAKVSKYLENGAQPSDRVVRILEKEGIKLPSWIKKSDPKKRSTRNPEKRRSTAPKKETTETTEAKEVEAISEPASEAEEEAQVSESTSENSSEDSNESA